MEHIGFRIESKRIELGLSKAEIWKAAGQSSFEYTHWMFGCELTDEALDDVAILLKVNPEWITSGKEHEGIGEIHPLSKVKTKHPLDIIKTEYDMLLPSNQAIILELIKNLS